MDTRVEAEKRVKRDIVRVWVYSRVIYSHRGAMGLPRCVHDTRRLQTLSLLLHEQ